MNTKITLSLFFGLIISVLGLYLAFRNVPLSTLTSYMISINYLWVIPALFVLALSLSLRVIRWQFILSPIKKVGFWSAFHPMMIGFMVNCVLPGRVGEVARPAILKKSENVSFSIGLATVAVERVFDMFTLIVFFAILFSSINIDPDLSIPFGKYFLNREMLKNIFSVMIQFCILFTVGIILININYTRKILNHAIQFIPALILPSDCRIKTITQTRIIDPVINFINHLASGFSMINQPIYLIICALLSMAIWLIGGFSYYVFAMGCPGIDLSFLEFIAVMLVICFFIALPSVPGFWGLWEAGGVFAMLLFGVPLNNATGFTLANHAIQIFPAIIVGFISVFITGVNILKLSYKKI